MSKAVLVMDMPEDCLHCKLRMCIKTRGKYYQHCALDTDGYCLESFFKELDLKDGFRSEQCPLVPVPEEFATDTNVGSNGWIPVEREFPPMPEGNPFFEGKPLEMYLVSLRGADYPFRAFWNGKFFSDGFGKVDAIAWQPLPEPWKGE